MQILVNLILLFLGIALLVFSARLFISSSCVIGGYYLRLPSFIIGVLIIAIGTSAPEVVTSFAAAATGNGALVIPNVYGTIVANICLGIGVASLVYYVVSTIQRNGKSKQKEYKKESLKENIINRIAFLRMISAYFRFSNYIQENVEAHPDCSTDRAYTEHLDKQKKYPSDVIIFERIDNVHIPFMLASVLVPAIMLIDKKLTLLEGGCLIMLFIGYIIPILIEQARKTRECKTDLRDNFSDAIKEFGIGKQNRPFKWVFGFSIFVFASSLYLLYISGPFIIEQILELSKNTGLDSDGLTGFIVALGTSVPEIAVACVAASKNNIDMLMGDILGSNIFDALVIPSICVFAVPAATGLTVTSLGLYLIMPFCIVINLIAFAVLLDRRLSLAEMLLLVFVYGIFALKLFI
ncbi:MAG TPA: hypothetical protein PLN69_03990 [bacterium]|nr:hypothetical protein [bacterium]